MFSGSKAYSTDKNYKCKIYFIKGFRRGRENNYERDPRMFLSYDKLFITNEGAVMESKLSLGELVETDIKQLSFEEHFTKHGVTSTQEKTYTCQLANFVFFYNPKSNLPVAAFNLDTKEVVTIEGNQIQQDPGKRSFCVNS